MYMNFELTAAAAAIATTVSAMMFQISRQKLKELLSDRFRFEKSIILNSMSKNNLPAAPAIVVAAEKSK